MSKIHPERCVADEEPSTAATVRVPLVFKDKSEAFNSRGPRKSVSLAFCEESKRIKLPFRT